MQHCTVFVYVLVQKPDGSYCGHNQMDFCKTKKQGPCTEKGRRKQRQSKVRRHVLAALLEKNRDRRAKEGQTEKKGHRDEQTKKKKKRKREKKTRKAEGKRKDERKMQTSTGGNEKRPQKRRGGGD